MTESIPDRPKLPAGPLHLLIVEDEPADAELYLVELRKAGLEVHGDVVSTAGWAACPSLIAKRWKKRNCEGRSERMRVQVLTQCAYSMWKIIRPMRNFPYRY